MPRGPRRAATGRQDHVPPSNGSEGGALRDGRACGSPGSLGPDIPQRSRTVSVSGFRGTPYVRFSPSTRRPAGLGNGPRRVTAPHVLLAFRDRFGSYWTRERHTSRSEASPARDRPPGSTHVGRGRVRAPEGLGHQPHVQRHGAPEVRHVPAQDARGRVRWHIDKPLPWMPDRTPGTRPTTIRRKCRECGMRYVPPANMTHAAEWD